VNVLLLMAGSSSAFAEVGLPFPKNLVEIDGLPLVERVLERVRPVHGQGHSVICLVLAEESRRFHTGAVIRLLVPDATVVDVPQPTQGGACTALLAIEHIGSEEPLLVLNGDQIVDADLGAIVDGFRARELDGGVVVFDGVHPRWSYVRCDDDGFVIEAAEKRPISRMATAGTYYFARGYDFVRAVTTMIRKDDHTDGVFYICPAYNQLILEGARIGVHRICREQYVSLSTPQGMQAYAEQLRGERAGYAAHEA
jgi:dTDP-glucose pyrophosphorylase